MWYVSSVTGLQYSVSPLKGYRNIVCVFGGMADDVFRLVGRESHVTSTTRSCTPSCSSSSRSLTSTRLGSHVTTTSGRWSWSCSKAVSDAAGGRPVCVGRNRLVDCCRSATTSYIDLNMMTSYNICFVCGMGAHHSDIQLMYRDLILRKNRYKFVCNGVVSFASANVFLRMSLAPLAAGTIYHTFTRNSIAGSGLCVDDSAVCVTHYREGRCSDHKVSKHCKKSCGFCSTSYRSHIRFTQT